MDRYIYLYSAYKSKESLGASVAKEMCLQRSSEGIEGKSRLPQSGWKIVPQSRTGCRETPVAKLVVCSWHGQLPISRISFQFQNAVFVSECRWPLCATVPAYCSNRFIYQPAGLQSGVATYQQLTWLLMLQ